METEVNTSEVVENVNDTTDYKALYETTKSDLEAKTGKVGELEGLIQKHKDKKTTKVENTSESTFWKEDMQKMLDERDFYSTNPTMSDHKEAIEKFTSNGLSHNDAMTLVMANDSTIAARQNTNNSNFTDWVSGGGTKTYSQEDLYNLWQKNPALKRQAMEEIAAGKATETI